MLQQTMHSGTERGFFRAILASLGWPRVAASILILLALSTPASTADQLSASSGNGLDQIRSYIALGWDSLTRSLADCKTIVDTKLATTSVLYMPADFEVPAAVQQLQKQCGVQSSICRR